MNLGCQIRHKWTRALEHRCWPWSWSTDCKPVILNEITSLRGVWAVSFIHSPIYFCQAKYHIIIILICQLRIISREGKVVWLCTRKPIMYCLKKCIAWNKPYTRAQYAHDLFPYGPRLANLWRLFSRPRLGQVHPSCQLTGQHFPCFCITFRLGPSKFLNSIPLCTGTWFTTTDISNVGVAPRLSSAPASIPVSDHTTGDSCSIFPVCWIVIQIHLQSWNDETSSFSQKPSQAGNTCQFKGFPFYDTPDVALVSSWSNGLLEAIWRVGHIWIYISCTFCATVSISAYLSFRIYSPQFSFLLFTDYGIYWIHRWLHLPVFYKIFHKPHHKWISESSCLTLD